MVIIKQTINKYDKYIQCRELYISSSIKNNSIILYEDNITWYE